MIIENTRDLSAPIRETNPQQRFDSTTEISRDVNVRFQEFIHRYRQIRDANAHYELRNNLIEHLWERFSNEEE